MMCRHADRGPVWLRTLPGAALLGGLLASSVAGASGIGHYNGGLLNVRDYFLPAHGVHGLLYNHIYSTDRLNDETGEQVDVVLVHPGPGPGIPLGLDVNVFAYVAAPTLILVKELNLPFCSRSSPPPPVPIQRAPEWSS